MRRGRLRIVSYPRRQIQLPLVEGAVPQMMMWGVGGSQSKSQRRTTPPRGNKASVVPKKVTDVTIRNERSPSWGRRLYHPTSPGAASGNVWTREGLCCGAVEAQLRTTVLMSSVALNLELEWRHML